MNRETAQAALSRGARLSHRFFSPHEWVEGETKDSIFRGTYSLDNGGRIDADTFWEEREGSEFDEDWVTVDGSPIDEVVEFRYVFRLADGSFFRRLYRSEIGGGQKPDGWDTVKDLSLAEMRNAIPQRDVPELPNWPLIDRRFSGGDWVRISVTYKVESE